MIPCIHMSSVLDQQFNHVRITILGRNVQWCPILFGRPRDRGTLFQHKSIRWISWKWQIQKDWHWQWQQLLQQQNESKQRTVHSFSFFWLTSSPRSISCLMRSKSPSKVANQMFFSCCMFFCLFLIGLKCPEHEDQELQKIAREKNGYKNCKKHATKHATQQTITQHNQSSKTQNVSHKWYRSLHLDTQYLEGNRVESSAASQTTDRPRWRRQQSGSRCMWVMMILFLLTQLLTNSFNRHHMTMIFWWCHLKNDNGWHTQTGMDATAPCNKERTEGNGWTVGQGWSQCAYTEQCTLVVLSICWYISLASRSYWQIHSHASIISIMIQLCSLTLSQWWSSSWCSQQLVSIWFDFTLSSRSWVVQIMFNR